MDGGFESPARAEVRGKLDHPLDFSARHVAMTRMCIEDAGQSLKMRWTAPQGVSGNPLSQWAWPFATEGFWKGKLLD